MKAFSWIAVFESSGKSQPTTSMKSLEAVLEQLQALSERGPLSTVCMWFFSVG